jgi:hypothetical protein
MARLTIITLIFVLGSWFPAQAQLASSGGAVLMGTFDRDYSIPVGVSKRVAFPKETVLCVPSLGHATREENPLLGIEELFDPAIRAEELPISKCE